MRSLAVFLFSTGIASASWISFGVKGGVPLSSPLLATSDPKRVNPSQALAILGYDSSSTRTLRYTIGPTLEFGLSPRISVEVDALYKHLKYTASLASATPSSGLRLLESVTAADRWEFPLLLKYHLPTTFANAYISTDAPLN